MTTKEIFDTARTALKGVCRVCPTCDGRACAGEVPGIGGCGTGASFQANVAALARHRLNLRTIHSVTTCDTSINLWGEVLTTPIMVAPMAGASYNLKGVMTEEAMVQALHHGSNGAGALAWGGDGISPDLFDIALASIASFHGRGIPTIKPRPIKELRAMIQKAQKSGALAVAIDIDAAGFRAANKKSLSVGPKHPAELYSLTEYASIPIILKGIMTPDEAHLAVAAGASGIVVSNHGGRVLDWTPGTAEVLPDIASAVRGRCLVFVDGGVRTGYDAFKMLALGADAVLVGRPLLLAAVGAGAAGVTQYLDTMHDELVKTMILTGVSSIRQISPSVLYDPTRHM